MKKILTTILLMAVLKSQLSLAQQTKSEVFSHGLYFISQSTPEWVGGGYYLFKKDSTFLFFTNIWVAIKDCGAIDLNPNYFGSGKWHVKNNILKINFTDIESKLTPGSDVISYESGNYSHSDSVLIKVKVENVNQRCFVESVNQNTIAKTHKKTWLVSKESNLYTIILPFADLPSHLVVSSNGYYAQKINLIQNKSYHSITLSNLIRKDSNCIEIVREMNISEKIILQPNGKYKFGSLMQIIKSNNQKEFILNKLKETMPVSSKYQQIFKIVVEELSSYDLK